VTLGRLPTLVALAVGFGLGQHVAALERPETHDPHQNYVLFCAGCHGLDGQGAIGRVPALSRSLPLLLPSPAGRAFVTHVPGVANSALSDSGLAGVLNWCVSAFTAASASQVPFTAAELHLARADPMASVVASRMAVFEALGLPAAEAAPERY